MGIEPFLAQYMRRAVRRQMNIEWVDSPFALRAEGPSPRMLYVHIPFCETLCAYCSFHRIRFEPEPAGQYFRSLRREIEMYKDRGFEFEDVYVGGGTPTVLPAELSSLIESIRQTWPIRQVSVETHPHHLTPGTIAMLSDAGVNRLSVGVQTFNGELLAKLSRGAPPDADSGTRERLQCVKGRFDTVNVDMIYNLPGQTADMVMADVEVIRDLEMDQVTFYPLMAGGEDFREIFGKIDMKRERLFFERIQAGLDGAYEPVSAWCFSRRRGMSDEYIVTHDEYAGLGSGAFGYVNGTLYANSFDLAAYTETLARSELPIVAAGSFSDRARVRYDLLMRLFGGSLDLSCVAARHGRRLARGLWKELLFLVLAGAVVRRDGRFVLTPRGRYHFVVLMREFFGGTNRLRRFLSGGQPADPGGTTASPAASVVT